VPPICNINAVIQCPHQSGIAKPIATQTKVNIGGAPALRATDMPSTPFLPGCPNIGTGLVPCTLITTPAMPASTKVFILGQPAMLATGLMTSNSVAPVLNGTRVTNAGQVKVIAAS